MIKVLKLQKAVIVFVLGIIALIAYKVMAGNDMEQSNYMLSVSGILLMLGALMFLYPIVFAKKDKEGSVELDPEKHEELDLENQKVATTEEPLPPQA